MKPSINLCKVMRSTMNLTRAMDFLPTKKAEGCTFTISDKIHEV